MTAELIAQILAALFGTSGAAVGITQFFATRRTRREAERDAANARRADDIAAAEAQAKIIEDAVQQRTQALTYRTELLVKTFEENVAAEATIRRTQGAWIEQLEERIKQLERRGEVLEARGKALEDALEQERGLSEELRQRLAAMDRDARRSH